MGSSSSRADHDTTPDAPHATLPGSAPGSSKTIPPSRDAAEAEGLVGSGRTLPASRVTARPPPPSVGDAARFVDEGEVARGGMSAIRRVVDRRLFRREAMKVLETPAAAGTDKLARATQRFVEEARITGQLDHPNIVPIYDLGLGADGSPAFITMKLVEGESFSSWLDRLGDDRLEGQHLEEAIGVLLKVCDAVSFAHGRGVIHCDIKPSNIMVGAYGQVYLMDWGLAVTTAEYHANSVLGWTPRPLRPGTVAGSPAYMSPEQASGLVGQIDQRTDVWGLGATLYRVLTGDPLYNEPTVLETVARAKRGDPTPCDRAVLDERLPPALCHIAMKALSRDPADRHPSAAAFKAELEGFLRGGGWLPVKEYAEGELILREGDEARAAFMLLEGVVEVFKTIGGKRVALRLMGPGEVFGEAAVFSSKPRSASVVAKSDVVVKVITAESLDLELSKNVALKALVRALAQRFRELDTALVQHQVEVEARSSPGSGKPP